MTAAEFREWIKTAPQRATVEYFRGNLASIPADEKAQRSDSDARIRELAGAALSGCHDGTVFLVQKRHAAADYSYLAVRSSKAA